MKSLDLDFGSFPQFTKEGSTNYLFGANNAWVSDIWAFWDLIIRRHKIKTKKAEKKYNFLLSLLEQAKYFFQAAETTPIKSQPLLYYYSFMNLAKIVVKISVSDSHAIWQSKRYMHGVSARPGTMSSLNDSKISCIDDINHANVAKLFLEVMGNTFTSGQEFGVKELLASCLGIHRAYTETYNTKETFFRLDDLTASVDRRTMNFSAVIHDCTNESAATLRRDYPNISNLDDSGNSTDCFKWKEELIRAKSGDCTKKDLFALASKLRQSGIWSITNGRDVSLYISSSPIRLSTESIIYLLMFFFGSITRYSPYLFDELLSDKNMWLMSEFLKTQPKQFIYLVTSRVLGRNICQSWMTNL